MAISQQKLPKKIDIMGVEYSIVVRDLSKETEEEISKAVGLDDSIEYSIQGLCEYNDARISISDKLKNKDVVFSVLYHEVVHALMFALGMNTEDEHTVQALSQGLLQVCKANGWLK